ncbi:DUF445 domain-containing protein [Flavobacterium branchiarum]|uniref:DUF445 domain-containing protein n=1 Tax=Flavobacterium branchiarum TaxID=1114870 RepID=A0ABV5FM91_9FLAO|nr:DUF445 domain-containing protein [Flavobacterium branchiarum]MDN3674729.1 DUF445 domain-containing protein [Flavobacterium branchiarum]
MKSINNQEVISKVAGLIKMKRFALGVLGGAVLLFLIAIYFKIGWLKAFSEAAMVGGIADWFAIVALFRHPLGLPIPHTALIPNNKDAIGQNLGTFVSDEFLIKEKLEAKIEQFNFAAKAADWLSEKNNANTIASLIIEDVIPGILKTIVDEDVQKFIQVKFEAKLQEINFGEWIAIGLESLTKSEKQEQLISNVLKILTEELQNNREVIREKVNESTPWYTLGVADKKIADGIFNGLYEFIDEAKHANSSIRRKINTYVLNFISELNSSPELQQKVNDLVIEFAHKKEVIEYIGAIWSQIKDAIATDLEKKEDSKIKNRIISMIQNFGISIKSDLVMLSKINDFIKIDLLGILLKNKQMIGDLIASSVKSWDKEEISNKLELEIGKDLQFIRINGTVVGGIVGLLIYFVEHIIT